MKLRNKKKKNAHQKAESNSVIDHHIQPDRILFTSKQTQKKIFSPISQAFENLQEGDYRRKSAVRNASRRRTIPIYKTSVSSGDFMVRSTQKKKALYKYLAKRRKRLLNNGSTMKQMTNLIEAKKYSDFDKSIDKDTEENLDNVSSQRECISASFSDNTKKGKTKRKLDTELVEKRSQRHKKSKNDRYKEKIKRALKEALSCNSEALEVEGYFGEKSREKKSVEEMAEFGETNSNESSIAETVSPDIILQNENLPQTIAEKTNHAEDNFGSRGVNGWEQSLRQKPKTVDKYQATFKPDSGSNEISSVKKKSGKSVELNTPKRTMQKEFHQDKDFEKMDQFMIGDLVWGKIRSYPYWPALVVFRIPNSDILPSPGSRWVKWFGDGKYSHVKVDEMFSFGMFDSHYQPSYSKKFKLYQKAVYQALKVCAARAKKECCYKCTERPLTKQESFNEDEALNSELIDWANRGFQPQGVDAIVPPQEEKQLPQFSWNLSTPSITTVPKKSPSKITSRDEMIEKVKSGKITLEDMCIACGSCDVNDVHPLFIGGLCECCTVEFLETTYLFDNDGYQSYCCVCSAGKELLLCSDDACYRSFCFDCVKLLDSSNPLKEAIKKDKWICYMCCQNIKSRLLTRRDNWPKRLMEMFKNDRVQDFEPFKSYVAPLIKDRQPIRVLALFDGIATGLLALKELGFQIKCYIASEVNEDAIKVSTVRHAEDIVHVGDVKNITKKQVKEWGPFDLVMGGSPCNDLSIVNPARKGLFGTGRLFFEFQRILTYAKPAEGDKRPFFWFLENVCFMEHSDKMDISRFLECNPVIVDAKDLSPAHRARYFWGNLPGMERPNVATGDHSLSLQECLEPNCNRQAQFKKIRTITTKSNSIKQSKEKVLPVLMNGKEDGLWCTEMERLFGFPEHYTDVSNMGRVARQRLLGRAWSVPVIKHLLAPLKDFFVCKTI
ncbi:DNA (cytosine-5)-methyltransferase 3C-like isoform X2 [Antedon mediterranea]|uniref:DNA (cytosine-5)-methyltransferase 3C-like isoform X2 n=1 Tax=Antedon mediterranea TaxID=105859 RepID=UPI003AF5305F